MLRIYRYIIALLVAFSWGTQTNCRAEEGAAAMLLEQADILEQAYGVDVYALAARLAEKASKEGARFDLASSLASDPAMAPFSLSSALVKEAMELAGVQSSLATNGGSPGVAVSFRDLLLWFLAILFAVLLIYNDDAKQPEDTPTSQPTGYIE